MADSATSNQEKSTPPTENTWRSQKLPAITDSRDSLVLSLSTSLRASRFGGPPRAIRTANRQDGAGFVGSRRDPTRRRRKDELVVRQTCERGAHPSTSSG